MPIIAHGLGVSLQVIALLVAARSLAGLAGPAMARILPRDRHRALMVGSQFVVLVGCALVVVSAATPPLVRTAVVAMGLVATGLARPLFDLPMQTWVSAHVPVTGRGRALGVTELGWALSLAASVPVAGVLIGRFGWHSPFLLVGILAGAGVLALLLAVPRDGPRTPAGGGLLTPAARPLRVRTRRIPTGVALCVATGLAVAAGESIFVVYGAWLAEDFGLSIAQIGASTVVIVVAELTGEGLVVALADRLGLCRTLFTGLLVSAAAYLALGLVGHSASAAAAAIALLFVAFEVTVVVFVAFASTVAGRADDRARLLGALMAAVAGGNAAGAALAPLLFAHGGIALSGAGSACAAAVAAAVLWVGSSGGASVAVSTRS